jgi:hypothetical protein
MKIPWAVLMLIALAILPACADTLRVHRGPDPREIQISTPWGDYVAYDAGSERYWIGSQRAYQRERARRFADAHFTPESSLRTRIGDVSIDDIDAALTPDDLLLSWTQAAANPTPLILLYDRTNGSVYRTSSTTSDLHARYVAHFAIPSERETHPMLAVFIIPNRTPGIVAVGSMTRATPPPPSATTQPSATNGTIVWQAGNPTLGQWVTANTYQCGNPIQTGAQFTFTLMRNGTACGRNQANPTLGSTGDLIVLKSGQQYTWTFHYIDGTPNGDPPGMGPDSEAQATVWQIHGVIEPDTPCTTLQFLNGPDGRGGSQVWALYTCAGIVWTGTYTPGETDDWKIVAMISEGSDGDIKLYRNGTLMVDAPGANYHHSATHQAWWNFGPYKWRWELPGGGGSDMTTVNLTIQNMLLTSP